MNPTVINVPSLLLNLLNGIERKPLTKNENRILTSIIEERKANYEDDRLETIKKLEIEYKEKKGKFERYIKYQFERQTQYDEEIFDRIKKLSK